MVNNINKNFIDKKILIVILGPTASGKTAVSLELAKFFNLEIISADSRQIYRYLDIGTAKPTKDEIYSVQHHFIDLLNPDEYYSAGLFGNQASVVANNILANNKLPVVVGGSGLYIKALCEGFFEETDNLKPTPEIRTDLQNRFNKNGIETLYDELVKVDKASAKLYSDKNPRRILRALEYYYTTSMSISKARKEYNLKRNFNPIYFGIALQREKLYSIINKRSEIMWNAGILEEYNRVVKMGYSPELNSLNTVGYKECRAYLEGKISEEKALELMKQNTRHYAKRQMTWFGKMKVVNWISGSCEAIANEIRLRLNK